jgi:hypothetical protein
MPAPATFQVQGHQEPRTNSLGDSGHAVEKEHMAGDVELKQLSPEVGIVEPRYTPIRDVAA